MVIATPNFTHAAILRDALATDLHILVEKPLVINIDDGLDLMQRAQGRKGIVWVAQEYRYMPPVAEMIATGLFLNGWAGVMRESQSSAFLSTALNVPLFAGANNNTASAPRIRDRNAVTSGASAGSTSPGRTMKPMPRRKRGWGVSSWCC